ncbi:MAG: hypothetical protein MI724_19215 [Spirochaetales bacterium]|nr:hypothetical protein [Spirochaetales bacterium]
MSFWDKMKKALVGEAPKPEEKPVSPKEPVPDATVSPAADSAAPSSGAYKACTINRGARGWGGPLTIRPTDERNLIYSVTGGGIHPVAQKIADVTGGQPFDGFKSKADFEKIAVAVIDCGGTARVGVYPMKGILTVDVHAASPSGPLAKYINETNFVSGVKIENVEGA